MTHLPSRSLWSVCSSCNKKLPPTTKTYKNDYSQSSRTPFWGSPKPGCSDGLCTGIIESHNFFCLRSYPRESSHRNSPNQELSNDLSDVVVRRRKVALHTIWHLTPTEAWRSAVSTTWEGRRVLSEVRLENCTQVWGWAKFGQRATHGWGKIALHTCSNLSKLVLTSPQYSDHVRPSRNVIFCTFKCSYSSVLRRILVKLHILIRLIESFPMVTGYGAVLK